MDYLLQATANYGFPMVVALYLLLRFEGKIDLLAATIQELIQAIKCSKQTMDMSYTIDLFLFFMSREVRRLYFMQRRGVRCFYKGIELGLSFCQIPFSYIAYTSRWYIVDVEDCILALDAFYLRYHVYDEEYFLVLLQYF